jgi:hypothetical protein
MPWTALNLGFDLHITKTRPRLFTTWQPGRLLALFKELRTFINFPFIICLQDF